MDQPVYGDIKHIQVGNDLFQIQSIQSGMDTSFAISRSGEKVCIISMNEEGQWQSDFEISEDQLSQITHWIKRLYE